MIHGLGDGGLTRLNELAGALVLAAMLPSATRMDGATRIP